MLGTVSLQQHASLLKSGYLPIGLKKISNSFNEHSSHHSPPVLLFVEVRIWALKKGDNKKKTRWDHGIA
jgi:hypothetical protein